MRAVPRGLSPVQVWNRGTSEGEGFLLVPDVLVSQTWAAMTRTGSGWPALADPRDHLPTDSGGADTLHRSVYWATGPIHSRRPAPGDCHGSWCTVPSGMSEGPHSSGTSRDNMIVLITPVVEPDGRSQGVDLAMAPGGTPSTETSGSGPSGGQYVANSNERGRDGALPGAHPLP